MESFITCNKTGDYDRTEGLTLQFYKFKYRLKNFKVGSIECRYDVFSERNLLAIAYEFDETICSFRTYNKICVESVAVKGRVRDPGRRNRGGTAPIRKGLHRRPKLLRIPAVGEVTVVVFGQ